MSESVVLNDAALHRLLGGTTSPVALLVERKARIIARDAVRNASRAGYRPKFGNQAFENHPPGPFMRTRNLVNNLKASGPFYSPSGHFWQVGSTATSLSGLNYPALLERGGLTQRKYKDPGQSRAKPREYRYAYLIPALENNPDFVRAG